MLTALRILATVLTIALSACAPSTLYDQRGDEITIYAGFGGPVWKTKAQYALWLRHGMTLKIDGFVGSADAFAAFSYPNACYTERAIWSPHAISNLGLYPLRAATERETRELPPPLRKWFLGYHGRYDWIGFARVEYPQLLQLWPAGACNQDHARMAAADPDWHPPSTRRSDWWGRYTD